MERIIDARNGLSPQVLDMAENLLKDLVEHEGLQVLVKDQASATVVSKLGEAMDYEAQLQRIEQGFCVSFYSGTTSDGYFPQLKGNKQEGIGKGNLVVMISRPGLGDGGLGEALMGKFISSLKALQDLPKVVIFYNAGVLLLRPEHKIYKLLGDLRELGVSICGCETSLEYYGIQQRKTGKLVYRKINMLEMVSYMAGDYKVINL